MLKQKIENFIYKSTAFMLGLIGLKPPTSWGYESLLFTHPDWGIERYYNTIFICLTCTNLIHKLCTKSVAYNLITEFSHLPEVSGRNLVDFFDLESHTHHLNGELLPICKSIFGMSLLPAESAHYVLERILNDFDELSGKKETYKLLALMCDTESIEKRRNDIFTLQKLLVELDRIYFKRRI